MRLVTSVEELLGKKVLQAEMYVGKEERKERLFRPVLGKDSVYFFLTALTECCFMILPLQVHRGANAPTAAPSSEPQAFKIYCKTNFESPFACTKLSAVQPPLLFF